MVARYSAMRLGGRALTCHKVSVEWKVKGRIGKDKGGETKVGYQLLVYRC